MKAIQRVIKGISKKVFWFRYRHYDREKKIKLLNKVCYHVGERTDVFAESLGSEPYLISIGDDTIIASDVSFVTHDASVYNAYRYLGKHDFSGVEKKGPIIVGNNCFVGRRSLLLPGAVIGDNSIIAAGSVVNGQIPPNEVWGGVPAHFIMPMEDYAKKVYERTEALPWKKDSLNRDEKELMRVRQDYYFAGHK